MDKLPQAIRNLANQCLGAFGLEVRRTRPPPRPSAMVDDPLEAMSQLRSGRAVVIRAPIEQCVIFNGMSLAPGGWHPLVAAAHEALASARPRFEGSRLQRYYEAWQPADALEALIGATEGPDSLRAYPSHLMHAPWLDASPDERLAAIRRIVELENAARGKGSLGVEGGYGLQGPVTLAKGCIEYVRLLEVLQSIRKSGFDRSKGDVTGQVLKRGDEYRFRIVHGHHRAAALAALGHDSVAIQPKMLLASDEVAHWPQVYRGLWAPAQAETYFNHHFDFDSRAWAQKLGMGIYGPAG